VAAGCAAAVAAADAAAASSRQAKRVSVALRSIVLSFLAVNAMSLIIEHWIIQAMLAFDPRRYRRPRTP
jgi:hypothetical protein